MMGALQQQANDADDHGFPDPGYAEVDPTGRYSRFNEILGKGSSKTVYRGFDEWQGIEVAWNQVQLHDFLQSPGHLERLYCEIHLLKALRHRAIMRLYASWVDAPRRTVNFLTELFVSGTLRQYREKHRRVSMAAVKHWCQQILDGLVYLHGHDPPIIHRDLKCDNIFVNGDQSEVKIGDLGLATVHRRSPHAGHCVGTPEFMAPEVYEESYDELADVYSFGMCVLEMVTLEYPYSECTNPVQIYKKVISGIKPAAFYKVRDPAMRRFIDKCLAPASQRPAARELLHDPFLHIGDGGFCSGDGDRGEHYGVMYNYLHQPSCLGHHAYSNGSMASNGLSNSIEGEDTPSEERSDCDGDDDDSRFHGIDLLFNEHEDDDETIAGVDITIKGREMEDGGIFLKLRITDKDGTGRLRNIYFPFDTEADTALSVATEMVAELDITDHEVTRIAEMIDGEVGALVPDWRPGPGMDDDDDAPDASSTACCQNCRPSSASSSGSLLDFMSSAARRGCRCAELHGRFGEITFQADKEQVHVQDSGCSSDDGGSQVEQCVKDKEFMDISGFAPNDTGKGELIKINIDGSFISNSGHGGWGVVARDKHGQPVMMAAGKLLNLQSAIQAEAMACIQTLKIVQEIDMNRIIIETDAMHLKSALTDEDEDRSSIAALIREARFLDVVNLVSYQVMYCPRVCNQLAHELAKYGASLEPESQCNWLDGFPDVL